ncbi:MAG: hypothetical protein KAF64_11915 [Hydrogenophaga sp.]|uniref:hypothetical protein n=1 Tax=Hydrogenophaga sp. TaxID=1904254 RepID=UPI0025C71CCD|nr:hypothetical protein [Hydrogenophaga sp.]MBU7574054.1 hypothetical protein [Hydrogenophaga sp.]
MPNLDLSNNVSASAPAGRVDLNPVGEDDAHIEFRANNLERPGPGPGGGERVAASRGGIEQPPAPSGRLAALKETTKSLWGKIKEFFSFTPSGGPLWRGFIGGLKMIGGLVLAAIGVAIIPLWPGLALIGGIAILVSPLVGAQEGRNNSAKGDEAMKGFAAFGLGLALGPLSAWVAAVASVVSGVGTIGKAIYDGVTGQPDTAQQANAPIDRVARANP